MQDVNNVIQGSESAFSADEYAQRIRRTRERLSRAGVDVKNRKRMGCSV